MSLRFDRNTPPNWNARNSRVDFTCVDSHARRSVPCAVSRAALEDSTGELLDERGCLTMFARHLARIMSVANSIAASRDVADGGVVLIDSEDLLQHFPVLDQLSVAAPTFGSTRSQSAAALA